MGPERPMWKSCIRFPLQWIFRSILQKKWTSFLKARLICHIPQYETLRGVCSLEADTSARTHFYAAFTLTTQWSVQGQWGGKERGQHRGWSRGQ